MSVLYWDATGEKQYEIGTDKGVLYPYDLDNLSYGEGVAWNGLKGFTESPSGAEQTKIYANNAEYGSLYSNEDFGFTLDAYTSPIEFDECDGTSEVAEGLYATQQPRKLFGFSCRTLIGDDVDGIDGAYKLHLVYGATASPSEHEHATINESPEPEDLSWECSTSPIDIPGEHVSAHLYVRSDKTNAEVLKALESVLYGSPSVAPRLPMPSELQYMFANATAAELHNMVYREDDITEMLTSGTLYQNIQNGTFKGIYPGQTFKATVNNIEYTFLVLGLDHYLDYGDTPQTNHHIVVCPKTEFGKAQMNSENATTGGYVGSAMYMTTEPTWQTALATTFGEHLLTQRYYLSNAVSGDEASQFAWYSRSTVLMSQKETHGVTWKRETSGLSQFPAFKLNTNLLALGFAWWLREVDSATHFRGVGAAGALIGASASHSYGLRPCFLLG